MWSYIWPIALVVLANTFYNIITKSTPSDVNAFLSLSITYIVAAAASFAAYLLTGGHKLSEELPKLNWTAFALGICIIALEVGYIYVYRAGWKVNTGSLAANISLACVLAVVGFLLYRESLSFKQVLGMLLCTGGLVLITL
ncbi:MAG: EamA family transporter [Clostridiales bacterium]|nr:EamA family transporter [Clostridiales bacterium]